ncbi:hypothetical protein [uncultured Clostridium sp.]|uniref:hypothetical protein n=1 Tax=uncultured Clostridium sp. TaxID=59620 RepID=UPI00263315AD|nr:hypothetical protein [uncultured Clostridium sp.]
MDSKLLLTIADLLSECPNCMKTNLEGGGLEITPKYVKRSCSCGYSIKLAIEEKRNNEKILKG